MVRTKVGTGNDGETDLREGVLRGTEGGREEVSDEFTVELEPEFFVREV